MLINLKKVQRIAACVTTLALAVAISVVSVDRLNAQAASANIQGTVTDSSGAAVPDAAVQIKNVNTGTTQNVTSNAQGRYAAADLVVGTYELRATKTGFQTVVRTGVTLTVGAQSVVDFSLTVGQQQQTVTVEAQASQVETNDSSVGTLTDQRQMTELPLNGRGFEQLIQMTGGVNVVGGAAPGGGGGFMLFGMQGRAPEYSIAGSRPEGQQILLDDESLQNEDNKGMSSVLGTSLGVEAIAEFQTLTNTYSAQFGGNGGVINAVSKSGTNTFHGSAYEFLRNDAFDARQFIDPAHIPEYRQNQFGGSVGGPIKKDKMFFFVNYEGIQLVQGETRVALVPGCNLNPAKCVITSTNPVTAAALASTLAIYPSATTVVNGQPEVTNTATRDAHENYILGRFDYNISDKDSMFVRYISDKSQYTEPFGGGGFGGTSALPYWPEVDLEHEQFATIEWRRLISPTLVNVAHASFSRPGEYEYNAPAIGGGLVGGQNPLQFFPADERTYAGISITGLTTLGSADQLPFNTTPSRFTEGDDIIWNHGAHNIRTGANIQRVDTNTFMPFFDGSVWSFSSLSNFVLGNVSTVLYAPIGDYANRDFREINFTPYVQDEWKVSKKLTLNLGLRWEFATNAVDQHNQLYEIPNVATAVAPYYVHVPNVMASNPNWRNFDPRFGFAYDPFANHKTSIRGGFGIFHEPTQPSMYTAGYWACKPWGVNAAVGLPFGPATYPNVPTTSGAPSCSPGWDYDLESTPYNMQYNLNVQQEITRGTILTLGFVGSRGLHGLTEVENNPPLICSYAQGPGCANPSFANGLTGGYFGYGNPGAVTSNPVLNPGLGSFPNVMPVATSRYNSLLVSVIRRFSRNVQFTASYNLSHCISDGGWLGSFNSNGQSEFENPYQLNNDKAICAYNQNQVFKANGLVALPFHGNRFVEGWQISAVFTANSGLPLNITDSYDESTGGRPVSLPARPNYSPNDPAQVINGISYPACNNQPILGLRNMYYNPNCFTIEAPGTLGNLGSDTVIGPSLVDFDIALLKSTKINERLRLQMRAEFFNLVNHTNLALPNASLFVAGGTTTGGDLTTYTGRSGAAGQITNMFGTPREIQFAMKLIF